MSTRKTELLAKSKCLHLTFHVPYCDLANKHGFTNVSYQTAEVITQIMFHVTMPVRDSLFSFLMAMITATSGHSSTFDRFTQGHLSRFSPNLFKATLVTVKGNWYKFIK